MRQIVTDYLAHRISRVEYVAQRRVLLDRIDREFNGDNYSPSLATDANSSADGDSSPDITLVPKS